MITQNSPIAVFDSGVGGISVLKELVRLLPHENFRYFGDSANAPYGTKTSQQVLELTRKHIGRMISEGAKAVVIACNTATSAAAEALRKEYPDMPIIGMEPALKAAVSSGNNPRVLVMATPMTLSLEKFRNLMEKFRNQGEIYLLPCTGLVELIEAGKLDGKEPESFLSKLLAEYILNPADVVVLGCTHYPFVKPIIQKLLGTRTQIIDGSAGTARELKRRLEAMGLLNQSCQSGNIILENSNTSDEETALCRMLFNRNI